MLERTARLDVVRGSIEHGAVAREAVEGVSHVLHLATSKETPESIVDVAIKGMRLGRAGRDQGSKPWSDGPHSEDG